MAIILTKCCISTDNYHQISAITAFRGTYHIVAYFIKKRNIVKNVVLGLDLITVLANLGLSIKVGIEEHNAGSKWDDYEEEATDTGFVTAGMNAVAGIAYFIAFAMQSSQPHVSAVGAIVMTGTVAGTAVLEGIIFKQKYDAQKKPLLPAPPAF